ncbi:MAG: hypothetical protein LBL00_06260, partial [Endomicrobium sp.]|nr:hypothetical protein [Endomicrobium sp.]
DVFENIVKNGEHSLIRALATYGLLSLQKTANTRLLKGFLKDYYTKNQITRAFSLLQKVNHEKVIKRAVLFKSIDSVLKTYKTLQKTIEEKRE